MEWFWLFLVGAVSGVFAGMGMGGGTFLIPLLTILLGVNQKIAQGINLVVFIPLAVICLIIYFKRHLIKLKNVFWLYIPAVLISAVSAFFASKIEANILKTIFGAFLVAFGIFWAILTIIFQIKAKNNKIKK
ncbi:MAG: sulfite exporter TauE/SafE family protein [Clostridia bacterium]|nr:sulfite exporter TauE/SafE family protein [Clostridia bacterium]